MAQGYNWQPLSAGLNAFRQQQNLFEQQRMQEAQQAQNQQYRNAMLGQGQQRIDMAQAAAEREAKRAAELDPVRLQLLRAQATRAQQGLDPQFAFKQRATAAEQYGLRPGTPEYQNFVLGTGAAGAQGKAGIPFRGQDGKWYLAQPRAQGAPAVYPLQGAPAPHDPTLAGDKATAQVVGKNKGQVIANQPKTLATYQAAESQRRVLDTTIREAIKMTSRFTAGIGGAVLKNIPETDAANLKAKLDVIKANAGFEKLQEMRNNSPTGGALGQVTERELAFLQSVWASVEQWQSPRQLIANLKRFNKVHAASLARIRNAYKLQYGRYPERGVMPEVTDQTTPKRLKFNQQTGQFE